MIPQAVDFLKQPYRADKRIKLDMEKLSAMRTSLMGKSISYDSQSGSVSVENRIEAAIAKVLEREEEINAEINRLVEVKIEVEKEIEKCVKDQRLSEVLIRRYILFQRWEYIASQMGYDNRYLFKIHKQALNKFASAFEKDTKRHQKTLKDTL